MSDNRLKVVKIENIKSEVKSNLKRAIDEFHEEIVNEIQEELTKMEQVKKQIDKIRKRCKLPDLSHLTWSQLESLELSYKKQLNQQSKQDILIEKEKCEIEQFKKDKQDNLVKGNNTNISFSTERKKKSLMEQSFNQIKTALRTIREKYANKLKIVAQINELDKNWKYYFDNPKDFHELLLKKIDGSKNLLHYIKQYYIALTNKILLDLDPSIRKYYLNPSKLDRYGNLIDDLLTEREAEAYFYSIFGQLPVNIGDFRNYAEELQRAWIKTNAKNDKIYRNLYSNEILDKVLFYGFDKHSKSYGVDDFIIMKYANIDTPRFRIVSMKSSDSSADKLFKIFSLKSSSKWYKDYVKKGIKTKLSKHLTTIVKNTHKFDDNEVKVISNLLQYKYSLQVDSIGGGLLKKLHTGSINGIEKTITKLVTAGKLSGTLDNYMNAIVKQNQLIELVQNGATRRINRSKGHWVHTNDVLEEIKLKVRINDKSVVRTSDQLSFLGDVFHPVIKMDESTMKISMNGFELAKIEPTSNEYKIAKYFNNRFEQISNENIINFDDNINPSVLARNPCDLVNFVTSIQRKILCDLFSNGFLCEIEDFLGSDGLEFVSSILSEKSEEISNTISETIHMFSVRPFNVIQIWHFPFGELGRLMRRNDYPSVIWQKFDEEVFRIFTKDIIENVERSILQNTKHYDEVNEVIESIENRFLQGLIVVRYFKAPIGIPTTRFFENMDNFVLCFLDKNGKPVPHTVINKNNIKNEVKIFYNIDWNKHDTEGNIFDRYDLTLPFGFQFTIPKRLTSERTIDILMSWKSDVVEHWKNILSKNPYDIPQRILRKFSTSTKMNSVAEPDLIVLYILMFSIWLKNWNDFINNVWNLKILRESLQNTDDLLIECKNGMYFVNDKEVYLGFAKTYINSKGSVWYRYGPYFVPHKNNFIVGYLNSLQVELLRLLNSNREDKSVKGILKWITKTKLKIHLSLI